MRSLEEFSMLSFQYFVHVSDPYTSVNITIICSEWIFDFNVISLPFQTVLKLWKCAQRWPLHYASNVGLQSSLMTDPKLYLNSVSRWKLAPWVDRNCLTRPRMAKKHLSASRNASADKSFRSALPHVLTSEVFTFGTHRQQNHCS